MRPRDVIDGMRARRVAVETAVRARGFRHELLLHAGEDEFLAGTVPFVEEGLALSEPVLVAVEHGRIALLRDALGTGADGVRFLDMRLLGRNPARIIPAWRELLGERTVPEGGVRAVGEPVWRGRRPAELVECELYERLLDTAFGDDDLCLLCLYDVEQLEEATIEASARTHAHAHAHARCDPFAGCLPAPASEVDELRFAMSNLAMVRMRVGENAERALLDRRRTEELVLAVDELATNSIRHGGGEGLLRLWVADETLLCEVCDDGHITEPLAGRGCRPAAEQLDGRGLWLVNQLCDLAQIRSSASGGCTVRLHMHLD